MFWITALSFDAPSLGNSANISLGYVKIYVCLHPNFRGWVRKTLVFLQTA